jgi:hypothetical protein
VQIVAWVPFALGADNIARYFIDTRNTIIHEGPVPLIQFGSVIVHDLGAGTDSASVNRQGSDSPMETSESEFSDQLAVIDRLRQMEEIPGTSTVSYHLWDRLADEKDAVELLSQHLDKLSAVVDDAAAKWDGAPHR